MATPIPEEPLTIKLRNLGVSCFDISPDGKYYAVAYTKEFIVEIYETTGSQDLEKWKLNGVLTEHILPVLALKWSNKNELLTCGADINSYVFTYNAQLKKWKGGLINITGNSLRALTACDWNKEGDRLAIELKFCSLSYFLRLSVQELATSTWATSTLPQINGTPFQFKVRRSFIEVGSNTITSIKYNPVETNILAMCSIDETLIVANLDIKNIGKYGVRGPNAPVLDISNVAPTKIKGWGNTVAWAPSGKNLTVAVHNCTMIRFDFDASYNATKKTLTTLRNLPFSNLFYSDENTLVGSGFDKLPLVFKYEEGKWVLKGACEKHAGGFLIKIEYNNTGKLSRDNDAKF